MVLTQEEINEVVEAIVKKESRQQEIAQKLKDWKDAGSIQEDIPDLSVEENDILDAMKKISRKDSVIVLR